MAARPTSGFPAAPARPPGSRHWSFLWTPGALETVQPRPLALSLRPRGLPHLLKPSHAFSRIAEPRLSGFLLSSRRPQRAAGSVFLIPEDSSHPRGQPPLIQFLLSAQRIDNQDTQSGLAPDVVGCSLKP